MLNSYNIRLLARADLIQVAVVLDRTELFPAELLPDMAEPYLKGSADHLWLVICEGTAVIGFAYCETERMTERTFNLLAIAVLPARQNRGAGQALVGALEALLRERQARVLLVETSGLDAYEATRSFYDNLGFSREARIRDFYDDGNDKIVFWKRL